MRRPSTLEALLLGCLVAACGDVSDLPGESSATQPAWLATIEFDDAGDAILEASTARISPLGERQVLLFPRGSDPVDAPLATPDDVVGAAFVVVRAMADGDFALEFIVGDTSAGVKRGVATRRLWKELTFSLGGPLAESADGRLVLRKLDSETPVVVDSIRFLR